MIQPDPQDQLINLTRSRFYGKYRGVVIDNDDPEGRGRLLVSVESVMGPGNSAWAMPCVPYAGDGVGFKALPDVGGPSNVGVWVEFEAGDPSYPIWSGFFWADGQMPEANDPAVHVWKTEKVTIRIDDNADEIFIETSSNCKVTINDKITSEASSTSGVIEAGTITLDSGAVGKVVLDSSGANVNNGALEVGP